MAGAEFSADVTFSQWFCSLINVCSSLQSLLCLFERNIALQPKIQGNLGDLYEQNDVSVSKVQFRFKVFIPRIPSVFRYRGKSLALRQQSLTHTHKKEGLDSVTVTARSQNKGWRGRVNQADCPTCTPNCQPRPNVASLNRHPPSKSCPTFTRPLIATPVCMCKAPPYLCVKA